MPTTTETPRQTTNIRFPKHFITLSRKVIIHRMTTADSLEARLFNAVLLLSVCGPGTNEYACLKDRRGFVQRDLAGEPIAAKYADLARVLNLDPGGAKSAISRAIHGLILKGSLEKRDGKLYPVKEPEVAETGNKKLPTTATFSGVAGFTFAFAALEPNPDFEGERPTLEAFKLVWYAFKEVADTDIAELHRRKREEARNIIESSGYLYLKKSQKRKKNRTTEPAAAVTLPEPPVGRSEPIADEVPEPPPPPSLPPVIVLPPVILESAPTPDTPPAAGVRDAVKDFLVTNYALPTAPDAVVLDEIAGHCADPAGVEQFIDACRRTKNANPRTWKYFAAIAAKVSSHRTEYHKHTEGKGLALPTCCVCGKPIGGSSVAGRDGPVHLLCDPETRKLLDGDNPH